jgi:hypothetical protein
VIETKPTQLDPDPALNEDLLRLRGFLERSDIEGARAFVKELEHRWPESERVRHFARVLAPPVARTLPGVRIRRLDQEYAWLRAHASEYPGCWLAVLGDRLVAADPDFIAVMAIVRQSQDTEQPLLFFQPKQNE